MRRVRALSVALLSAAALALGGCADQTELLVEVTSPLRAPEDIDHLDIQIDAVTGTRMAHSSVDVTSTWPHRLAVRPGADHAEMVRVTVTGRKPGAGGRVVSIGSATAMFVPGTTSTVTVVLPATCTDPRCLGDGGVDGGVDASPDSGCTSPTPEICDGIDNDCDGIVDNGFLLQTDSQNCGRCGNVCGPLPHGNNVCRTGTCTLQCDTGRADCDGMAGDGCEADLGTAATCGDCATACTGGTPACQAGATGTFGCVSGCSAPTPTLCSGSCIDTTSSATNCGACGMTCPSPPNTVATCAMSLCGTMCRPGYDDCDMMGGNGCETNLGASVTDCGACGNACVLPHATPGCVSGMCAVAACDPGFADCNLVAADGCETPLDTLTDCGACRTACTRAHATADCSAGSCSVSTCGAGFGDCDALDSTGCETPLTTLVNCGTCGSGCSRANATASCATGTCGIGACSAGFGDCDGSAATGCETSLLTTTDCGACGQPCVAANATTSCATGTCTMLACSAGYGDCDADPTNGCETRLNTLTDCGGCGVPCSVAMGNPSCTTGSCVSTGCRPGYADCDMVLANGCETALDQLANCGACATSCVLANATASCAGATCHIAACNAGFADCDLVASNGCETPLTTLTNCGACGTTCARANGSATCATGACVLTTCNAGFGNCDANPSNGCETPLNTLANCAACGTACMRANATPTCATGSCQIASCNAGFDDCNAMSADGCERALTTLTDCATCGTACMRANATASCASGSCGIVSCNAGFGNCDLAAANGCEAPLTTAANCGACGSSCNLPNATASCATGTCTLVSCNAGFGNCDGNAANGCEAPLTTAANCGMCGVGCTRTNAASSCATGACVLGMCNAGFGNCDANAANGCETPLNTLTNCAGCGVICDIPASAETCASGTCVATTCTPGFGDCDGMTANGCETALNSLTNCAACATACARANATPTCSTGSCAISTCNAGFGNCDATDGNGCETSLTTLTNCSTCGTACSRANASATCGSGSCAISACNAGFGNCDAMDGNGCETVLTSLTNCAACGTACARANATPTCATGACAISSCTAGFGNCDAMDGNGCETALTSLTNCGGCAVACARTNATATCATGSCAIASCNAGFGNCDGNATNGCEQSLNTLANCGGCAVACSRANATATCGTGFCAIATCTAGFGNCDAIDSNGCEVALTNFYHDADADGYGAGAAMQACSAPVGYVANNTDCNDANAAVNPGHAEVCGNAVDDNCNGMTDEGCGGGTCSGAGAVSPPGGRFAVTLGPDAQTGSCGGAGGSEGYLAFSVSALTDVFITTLGTTVDTVVYVRSASCTGTEMGCNDNADGSALASSLHLTALAAGTYNVFIDTKAAMSATISVDIFVNDATSASDRCGNPTFIPTGTANISGTTCGFASDYSAANGQGDCNFVGDGADADRVYYFYLPTARAVTFAGCQPATVYDTTAYVRNICTTPGLANQFGCDEDGCAGAASCTAGSRSTLTTAVLPAGLYYFFADGYWQTPSWPCSCGAYQYNLTGI